MLHQMPFDPEHAQNVESRQSEASVVGERTQKSTPGANIASAALAAAVGTEFQEPKVRFSCRQVPAELGKGKTGRKGMKRKPPGPSEAEEDVSAPCPQCEGRTEPADFRVWRPAWARPMGIVTKFDRACKSYVSAAQKVYRAVHVEPHGRTRRIE